jgi:formate dehydrogenase subunit gamma
MTLPSESAPPLVLVRFDAAERALHWTNAVLFLLLLATGFTLRNGTLEGWVGHRYVVEQIHVWAGIALPIVVLAMIALRVSPTMRTDIRRLARWTRDDRRWWRRSARSTVQLGKFNPGQKLNATFIAAAIVVMPVTGSIMYWARYFPLDQRRGATFVHEWWAYAILAVVIGHIGMALRDLDALRAMVKGWVPTGWARRHAPRWHAEMLATAATEPAAATTRSVEAEALS